MVSGESSACLLNSQCEADLVCIDLKCSNPVTIGVPGEQRFPSVQEHLTLSSPSKVLEPLQEILGFGYNFVSIMSLRALPNKGNNYIVKFQGFDDFFRPRYVLAQLYTPLSGELEGIQIVGVQESGVTSTTPIPDFL